MKPDYSELDHAILQNIEATGTFFVTLATRLEQLAAPHAKRTKSPFPTPPWRIVDRRLQALRKAGKVRYEHKHGWLLNSTGSQS